MIKPRIIWIIALGLLLAIGLLVAVQFLDIISRISDNETPPPTVERETPVALGVKPTLFTDVIEFSEAQNRKLRLTGTAEPNSVVIILDKGQRTRQIRSNDIGSWSVTLDTDDDQPMVLEAILFNEGGITVRGDETIYRIVLPVEAPAEDATSPTPVDPSLDEALRLESGEDMAGLDEQSLSEIIAPPAPPTLIMVSAPGGPTRIVKSPFGGSPTNGPLTMGPIDYDDSGGVIFSGVTSEPGVIRLYANRAMIGETRVGPSGRWNFIAGKMLPRGEYDVRAELVRADGTLIDVTVPFALRRPRTSEGAINNLPQVTFEPFRWQVRRELLGGGFQTTVIFAPLEAEPLIPEEG